MKCFVFNHTLIWRASWVSAALSGVAVFFFGAPFVTVILVPAVESVLLILAQDWCRKHGYDGDWP